jgi:transposase
MKVYLGIDCSQHSYDANFLNEAGAVLARLGISSSPEGFLQLDAAREKLGIPACECLVALESAHNLLVDFLWDHGYSQVYVIAPHVIKSCRDRYRHSGARTDPSDAYVLADVLRTDRHRFYPWYPDQPNTRQIRAMSSLVDHLGRAIVRHANRLRAVLARYYPAALSAFRKVHGPVALHFIQAYPTPEAAAQLTWDQFQFFARQHHYTQRARMMRCFSRLQTPQPEAAPAIIEAYQEEAVLLAGLLLSLVEKRHALIRRMELLFGQHPDHGIFASLPGAGSQLAPALLAKFGDDRSRFPTPATVQALAGSCPVTDSSGKRRTIKFRRACDREFRRIAQQWARCSLQRSLWAQAYWAQVRPRCSGDSHALRCLANRWLAIAWSLWQKHQAYDEAYHLHQRALHSRMRA